VAGSGKIPKREKSLTLGVNGRSSTWRKERGGGGVQGKQLGQGEKCRCDVCGTFSSASYNKLLCCGRCPVKVRKLTWTWGGSLGTRLNGRGLCLHYADVVFCEDGSIPC